MAFGVLEGDRVLPAPGRVGFAHERALCCRLAPPLCAGPARAIFTHLVGPACSSVQIKQPPFKQRALYPGEALGGFPGI